MLYFMKYIDLHVHSTCSDGTFTPSELVAYAVQKNLSALALTDHDTIDGLETARTAAKKLGLELVSGIEFSTEHHGKEIHILGLDIDPKQQTFTEQLKSLQEKRQNRNLEMAERLRTRAGIPITLENLKTAYGNGVLTRAHFGRWLFEQGYVSSVSDAFTRYIGNHCPCFVPQKSMNPKQAISLILQAKGIPILAHPLLYHLTRTQLQALVLDLKEAGLLGIEALYSTHTALEERMLRHLAKKQNLKISGGSDFHGTNKPLIELGCGKGTLKIPYEILTQLREE